MPHARGVERQYVTRWDEIQQGGEVGIGERAIGAPHDQQPAGATSRDWVLRNQLGGKCVIEIGRAEAGALPVSHRRNGPAA